MTFLRAWALLGPLSVASTLCAANFQGVFGVAPTTTAPVTTAIDETGNIYVAGTTTAPIIPVTPGAFQQTFIQSACGYIQGLPGTQGLPVPCSHGFVAKIDPTGRQILWATYLGGELQDSISAICVDADGSVYVTGGTSSTAFPITSGAWFNSFGTESFNGFVTKLSPDGSKLVFSTYLPGATGSAIAVDGSNDVFVAGFAAGNAFPATPGAYQTQRHPGNYDAFVLKLNPSGSAAIYSTLLGGTFADVANALAIDRNGDAFVAGYTASIPAYQTLAGGNLVSFPSTPGALYQPGYGADVFVSEVNPAGAGLIYSSVFGGHGNDSITSIAIDTAGAVYFTGSTDSLDWPLTENAARTKFGQGIAGKLSADGSHLIYSTFVTGQAGQIALHSNGDAIFTGFTLKPDLATTPNALMPCFPTMPGNPSYFVMALDPSGGTLYASFLESAPSAVTSSGNVYLQSQSSIFDLINIFTQPPPGIRCMVNAADYVGNAIAPGEIISIFGLGIGPPQPAGAVLDSAGNVTAELANTRVLIGGHAAPLLYVSTNQINAVVPFEIAGQTNTAVQIETNGSVTLPVFSAAVAEAAPAIFTLDGSGYGQAAVLNQDGSVNSASNPAAQGSIVTFFATGIGEMKPQPADGAVPSAPTAVPSLPLTMYIGGAPGAVQFQYAGDAPGLVEGAVQINAIVPEFLPTGAQFVQLRAGNEGAPLPLNVTIFVQ